ncbi:MAG TPA: PD-(D/E)XK nuclease family protein [Pyrinomonadaceae bacterium]|jgi:hypothetical protein|nr:PD-(D/E)XK nuclease family protein [Pyrinomonadaceae bacterium]
MSKYLEKIRRFEFTDILGWSYSRYDTFSQCKRKYYYQYYAKHDIENVAKIRQLAKLTTIPLEVGNISHKLVQRLLTRLQKSAAEIDLPKFYEYAERESLDILNQKEFEDVYYQKRDLIDFHSEVLPDVARAMENFLKSDRLRWLFEEALVTKDDWIIELDERSKYGECRIDHQKAYCKVDFMFPIGDELHIIDWKSGKEDYGKHSVQLKGYAGWANFQFGADYSSIKPVVAYLLPEYKENSIDVTEFDIDEFSTLIRNQTEDMYQYCAEPELNMPLPKEAFAMTENERFCKFCKYRELCERV